MPLQSDKFRSWLPHGFDFESPHATQSRLKLESRIRNLFSNHNLIEVCPPLLDYANTFSLIRKRNQNSAKSFEFMGDTSEKLAIRSDITVQIIKASANRRLPVDDSKGFAYIQPVFQNHKWGSGANRELIQAGVEWIGEKQNRFEFMMQLAREFIPEEFPVTLLYGDARFIKIISEWFPIEFRKNLNKDFLNKDNNALIQLADAAKISESRKNILTKTPLLVGSKEEVIDELKSLCQQEKQLLEILEHAQKYKDVLFDFSLVSELSYYTGSVFEGYVEGSHKKILSGGIYDDLYKEFSTQKKDACGFGMDVSGLIEMKQDSK